jgi:hypothetical protein
MHRLSILISLGLALAACTASEGDEGIFISKNVAPATGCTFSASASELFLTHGTMSLAGSSYKVHPQMVSKITATDTNVQARTILVRGARVDIELTDSSVTVPDSVLHFESRFAAPIAPNGGITDAEFVGLSSEFIDAMRTAYGGTKDFETEVIINAVVFGDLSGSEVTSQKFQFPVTVCTNCVVNVRGTCPLPAGTTVQSSPGVCSQFQDGYSECCTLASGELQCPATVGAQYALTATVTGTMTGTAITPGTGTVTSAPAGINCLGDCDEIYNQGTVVTLTATATPATVAPIGTTTFAGWTGNCTGTGTCMVTMDAAKNVTATFNHNAP